MTTSDNISAIEAIEKAMEGVTPGPWFWVDTDECGREYAATVLGTNIGNAGYPVVADIPPRTMHGTHYANAAYIAACNPVAMSAILAEARKAEANEQLSIANGKRAKEEHYRAEAAERKAAALTREIAEKDARIAALEEALKPFAEEAGVYDPDSGDSDDIVWATPAYFKIRELRRARTLLNGGSDAQPL